MRKDKKAKKGRQASIDGIIGSSQRLGVPVHRSYRPNREPKTPTLGDYQPRAEGFHPMRAGTASLGEMPRSTALDDIDDVYELDIEDQEETKPKKRRRLRLPRLSKKRVVILILLLVLSVIGYLGIKFYLTQRNLFSGGGSAAALNQCANIKQLQNEGDCRLNILLLGEGGPGHDGGDLTDTIMIASIDTVNNKVDLLSLPRDLWVNIPGDGQQKINAAYTYGKQQSTKRGKALIREGIKKVDETLAPIVGVPIHFHVLINFKAFKSTVDAVGGVDVNVTEQLYDPTIAWENNYDPVIAKKGVQHFNGQKALLYAKSRETSSDFARAQRQRAILVALKEKVFSVSTFSNPVKLSNLMSSLGGNIYTDFSLGDIKKIHEIIGKVSSQNIKSLDLVTPPNDLLTTSALGGLSIVQPKAGLFNYDAIRTYIKSKALRDAYLAKEDAGVAVYNATSTAGIATSTANTLKGVGYKVVAVDNSANRTDPATTLVIDISKGVNKYTRHYLEKRFKVITEGKIPAELGINPPPGTAFVIILGKDASTSN